MLYKIAHIRHNNKYNDITTYRDLGVHLPDLAIRGIDPVRCSRYHAFELRRVAVIAVRVELELDVPFVMADGVVRIKLVVRTSQDVPVELAAEPIERVFRHESFLDDEDE